MSPVLRPACLAMLSLAFVAASAQAQAVYTWKDAKGVTHYSDSPPPKGAGKAKMKSVQAPQPATGVAKATASVDGDKTSPQAAAKVAAANARCSQARANLQALQGTAPVGPDADGDGKPDTTLSADDRAKQVEAMQAAIQGSCSGS